MKAKFGAIVVDGRGKIGGHVASKNRGGAYFRTKVSPSQPNSTYSSAVRARLSSIASSWRSLTEAQRSQWNDAVSSYKKTNIFGDVRNPSGFNLYQELNNNLVNAGEAMVTIPPTPKAVDALTSLSAAADNSSNSLILTFAPAIAVGHAALIRATPAISPEKVS